MRDIRCTKTGFTIIELLIVITIILILAVMGAGAYSVGRRIAVIDTHAEKLVSQLNASRDKAKAVRGADGPLCYGFIFEKGKVPQAISTKYSNNREGCNRIEQPVTRALSWQPDVTIKSLKTGVQGEPEKFQLLFSPPHGTITLDNTETSLTIELSYKDRTRTIKINEASGLIEKTLN